MQFIRPSNDRLNNSHTKLLLRGDAIADASPNGRSVTNYGSVSSISAYGGGKALSFNGANYLTVGNSQDFNFGSGDFTLDGFVYTVSTTSDMSVISKDLYGFNITLNTSTTIGSSLSSSGTPWDIVSAYTAYGTRPASAWFHMAIVRTSGRFKIFVDGVVVYSLTNSSPLYYGASALYVGTFVSGEYPFSGQLSNMRVTKGAALWTKNFIPPKRVP